MERLGLDPGAPRPPSAPGNAILRASAVVGVAVVGAVLGMVWFEIAVAGRLRPWWFSGLSPQVTVSFAVVGTTCGAAAWAVVRRRARRPRVVVRSAALAVLVVSLVADLTAGAEMGWVGASISAVHHVLVIAMSVTVLRWAMPLGEVGTTWMVTPARTSAMPALRRWTLAAGLVVAALAWVAVNKGVEGPTLLLVTRHSGVTLADLLAVAALVTAGHLVRPPRRPERA